MDKGVGVFWRMAKSTAQKVLSNAFCCYGKIAGVVCFFEQKQCLEHQSVALKEVCGDKYVQEYIMYVLTNPSMCVRERDGGGIKCLLFFLPNT